MEHYRLIGQVGSPYSMKMRAIMRYRRLPHVFVVTTPKVREEIAHVRPAVIPVLQYPDGDYRNDSTPLIYDLEKRHPGQRSIVPDDPGLAFLAHLIEDLADEWVTKMMFIYRWWREVDQKYCSTWLSHLTHQAAGPEVIMEFADYMRNRQVDRMPLVGNTEITKPVIEESFHDLLDILKRHFHASYYFFGSRPSLAEFGLFGQLFQLAHDPTSQSIMRERAPGVAAWVSFLDDASGLEDGEWMDPEEDLPEAVIKLLKMAGEVYFPFLLANKTAFDQGEDSFSLTLMGKPYTQRVFKYQVKCLNWLKEEYAALAGDAKDRVDAVLTKTACRDALHG